MRPILYSFRRCPYAMRARLALMISGQQVILREVVLRDKPPAMLDISPKGSVPVLQLPDGTIIDESIDVMRYALSINDPENWLASDTDESAALIDECHDFFIPQLNKYKYANRDYGGIDPLPHRAQAVSYLEKLNEKLLNSNGLFTPKKGFADYTIFPFVRQFASVDRPWFQSLPLDPLKSWLNDSLESDLFKSIMRKYPQWHEGDTEITFGE